MVRARQSKWRRAVHEKRGIGCRMTVISQILKETRRVSVVSNWC